MKIVGGGGYEPALRERVVNAVEEGQSLKDVATRFVISLQTVQSYVKRQQQGTLYVIKKSTGRPFRVTAEHEAQLFKQLKTHADATLVEHARMLEAATGLKVSFKTVDRAFTRLKITHKKNAGRQRTG